MKNIEYLLLLHNIWFSQKNLSYIFKNHVRYKDIYEKISYNLLETYWMRKKQIESILEQKKKINLDFIKINIKKRNTSIITVKDIQYPEILMHISNPPYVLYIRWKIDSSASIAVVWSRDISLYWKKVIENIIPKISKYFTIISWWAAWCDTKAHKETLLSKWKTICVIGTWINIDYPTQNKTLYDNIVKNWWGIVSIFPFNEQGNPYNFPIRNEIVAWLSVWVLIIEAREKSWSLITAKLALDLWKDLFSIPWDIFKQTSTWCNNLILKWEAKLIKNYKDILLEYNISFSSQLKIISKNKIIFSDNYEENIYNALTLDSYSLDELYINLWYNIQLLNFKISMMEINMLIKKIPGWKYEII